MPNLANSSFTNDAGSGTVGADGYSATVTNGLTAKVGGGIAGTQLNPGINVVATVASAADSVLLPISTQAGMMVQLINAAASNSLQAFGQVGDTINGIATGTGMAHAAGKVGTYISTGVTPNAAWYRLFSA